MKRLEPRRVPRTLRRGEEKKHLDMLNLAYNPWGNEEEWMKRYVQPGFDVEKNVLVVEEGGEWVGGGTAWFREVFLQNDRKLKVYTAGDLYVDPARRGKGIYSTAMESLNRIASERGAALGFAFPSIYRMPSMALKKYGFVNVLYPKTKIYVLNPEGFLAFILSQLKEAFLPPRFDNLTFRLTVRFSLPNERRSLSKTFRVEKGALVESTEPERIDLRVTLGINLLLKISSTFYLGKKSLYSLLFSSLILGRLKIRFSFRFLKAFLRR